MERERCGGRIKGWDGNTRGRMTKRKDKTNEGKDDAARSGNVGEDDAWKTGI